MPQSSPRLPERPPDEEILDHFVSGDTWRVPSTIRVEVVGRGPIPVFRWSGEPPIDEVHAGPGLLEDVLKLDRAKDDAILRYARRWGPLWLCGHVLPFAHDDSCWVVHEIELRDGDRSQPVVWWQEPIAAWRTVSRELRAVVRIARQLHNGQLASRADWESMHHLPHVMRQLLYARLAEENVDDKDLEPEEVGEEDGQPLSDERVSRADVDNDDDRLELVTPRQRRLIDRLMMSRLDESVQFQRNVLGAVLDYWLTVASVRPSLDWSDIKPAVHLAGQGLFGALAVQLLFECARTDGLAVCASCGTPFLPPSRRPRRDHATYCSDCGLKAAQRDAAARYRRTAKYKATYGDWLNKRRGSSTKMVG